MGNRLNILLSGCSFMASGGLDKILAQQGHNVQSFASFGAGNQYIADAVIKNYSQTIDYVYVLFSGLWRLDYALPKEVGNLLVRDYAYCQEIGSAVYIHSGGLMGSWRYHSLDSSIRSYFDNHYRCIDTEYLAEHSLLEISKCINFLKAAKIKYNWGFIYDIFANYDAERYGGMLGHVSESNKILDQIDWTHYIDVSALEYGKKNSTIDSDGFHLTMEGYQQYFNYILPKLQISNQNI